VRWCKWWSPSQNAAWCHIRQDWCTMFWPKKWTDPPHIPLHMHMWKWSREKIAAVLFICSIAALGANIECLESYAYLSISVQKFSGETMNQPWSVLIAIKTIAAMFLWSSRCKILNCEVVIVRIHTQLAWITGGRGSNLTLSILSNANQISGVWTTPLWLVEGE